MLNHESWLKLIDDDYLDNFAKFNTRNDLNVTPVNFKKSDKAGLPIRQGLKKQYVNIFTSDEETLTEEYLKENNVSIFMKSKTDLSESEKFNSLYFASSVNLNKIKVEVLKAGLDKKINFGVDPYSLGLWQSKLLKSQIKFSELNQFIKKEYQFFRVSTLAYDMSGADIIQQLAIVLSSCVQLIRDYDGVLSVDDIFKMTSFEISLNSNTLMNVVKLQSLRLLLDKLKETYKVTEDEDSLLYSIASPRFMASREIWNNLLRLSSVNLSSHMGGADGYIHQSFDLFSENKGSRLTRNISLIAQNESFVEKVQYPTLGSYSLDKMSENICQKSWEFFQEIDSKEGLSGALRSSWLQNEILRSSKEELDLFLSRDKKMTGVNDFVLLKSLSKENVLPLKSEVIDIQTWWDRYYFDEENEKFCDVEKLVPEQLSSFFEKWQFQADFLRSNNISTVINLAIEPGLEKNKKLSLVKDLVNLSGCETQILGESLKDCPIVIIVASDPEGEFVKGVLEKFDKNKSHLLFWAGEKTFPHFAGSLGLSTNLMDFYAQIFKKWGEKL